MNNLKKNPVWEILGLFLNLGFIIAIPLVIFTLGGRYLDNHLQTSPLFLLIGILFSIISSSIWLVIHFKRYLKLIEEETDKEKNNHKQT